MDSEEIDTTLAVLSQPSGSRRRPQDEEPTEPRRRRRIPSSRSFVLVLEVELASEGRPEGVLRDVFITKLWRFKHGHKLKALGSIDGCKDP